MTGPACDPYAHCITCGDEGIPMRVERAIEPLATCRDGGRTAHEVDVELVWPVQVGDELLVHAGVAIRNLSAVT